MIVTALVLAVVARTPPPDPPRQLDVPAVGFNLVEPQEGAGYGSQAVLGVVERLARVGASCVALVLPARLRDLDDDSPRLDGLPDTATLRRVVQHARAHGLQVLVVPQLWIDGGAWRGEIRRQGPRADAFFAGYGRFVDEVATRAEAAGADVLSLGVELRGLTEEPAHAPRFAALIAHLRTRFHGVLTYGANWDEAAQVTLWDQLDLIAVNAFYPLASAPRPSAAALEAGARAMLAQLDALARRWARPVLIVELGYKAVADTAREPWLWPQAAPSAVDTGAQAAAYRAALAALREQPRVVGVLSWVVSTGSDDPQAPPLEPAWGFCPLDRPAEAELRAHADWARARRRVGRAVVPPPRQPGFRP